MSHIQQIFHFSKVNQDQALIIEVKIEDSPTIFFLFSHTILSVNRSLL